MIKKIVLVLIVFVCNSALAMNYQISTYEGTVGGRPVHFSLQSIESGVYKSGVRLLGAYYYDRYLDPIMLYGGFYGGSLRLCETVDLAAFQREVLEWGSVVDIKKCPFTLASKGAELVGVWRDGDRSYDVVLRQKGRMDTRLSGVGDQVYEGDVSIPFWSREKNHIFVGVYGPAEQGKRCCIRLNRVLAVNRGTGNVDDMFDLPLDDRFGGMSELEIYKNVEVLKSKRNGIAIHCEDRFDYVKTHVFRFKKK